MSSTATVTPLPEKRGIVCIDDPYIPGFWGVTFVEAAFRLERQRLNQVDRHGKRDPCTGCTAQILYFPYVQVCGLDAHIHHPRTIILGQGQCFKSTGGKGIAQTGGLQRRQDNIGFGWHNVFLYQRYVTVA